MEDEGSDWGMLPQVKAHQRLPANQKVGDENVEHGTWAKHRTDSPSQPELEPTLPTPWFWTSRLQNWEMANLGCLNCPVCGTSSPSGLTVWLCCKTKCDGKLCVLQTALAPRNFPHVPFYLHPPPDVDTQWVGITTLTVPWLHWPVSLHNPVDTATASMSNWIWYSREMDFYFSNPWDLGVCLTT